MPYFPLTAGRCVDVGTVKYGTRQGSGTSYGSTVSFSCNSGYDIVGSAQRTCQQSGVWSGEQPRCVREYLSEILLSYRVIGAVTTVIQGLDIKDVSTIL